jgi:hypothetical protein
VEATGCVAPAAASQEAALAPLPAPDPHQCRSCCLRPRFLQGSSYQLQIREVACAVVFVGVLFVEVVFVGVVVVFVGAAVVFVGVVLFVGAVFVDVVFVGVVLFVGVVFVGAVVVFDVGVVF